MSDSMARPWILNYVLDIAKTVGADLTRVKREEKQGRRVQIIDFITYPREDSPDDVIWTRVSDKNFYIPVKLTETCVAEYNRVHNITGKDEDEDRLTTKRYAIVSLSGFKLCFTKVPLQHNQGIDEVYRLALEVDHIKVAGAAGEGTFANPKDIEEDDDLRLWVHGLRAQDGSGNVLMEQKNTKSGTDLAKKKKVTQNIRLFAAKDPPPKATENQNQSGDQNNNTSEVDKHLPSTKESRIKERRARHEFQWQKYAEHQWEYTFIPEHYAVQHNDILEFGQDRKDKQDGAEPADTHDNDIAPLPEDFLVSSLEPETTEAVIPWPPSDDEEVDTSKPRSQASEIELEDEREASNNQDLVAPTQAENGEEGDNTSNSAQDVEKAAESDQGDENHGVPVELTTEEQARHIFSESSPSANENPEADANDVSISIQDGVSSMLSQLVALQKSIQILVPDSDISMSQSQSQSQPTAQVPETQPSHGTSLSAIAPRVLVADSSQSQSTSQQDSQTSKSSRTETDSQPHDSLLFANNTYPSPVGDRSMESTNGDAVGGPVQPSPSKDISITPASAKSTASRSSKNSTKLQSKQQTKEVKTKDKLVRLNAPLDEDDQRIHNMLTSSLGSSSNLQLPQKRKVSNSSDKASTKQDPTRKQSKDPEGGTEKKGESAARLPQKRRRLATPPPASDVPRTCEKEDTVVQVDSYTVARVNHDAKAWEAPSFVQNPGAPAKPKPAASSTRSEVSLSTRTQEPAAIPTPPSTESMTASKKSKTKITRSSSVVTTESRRDGSSSRSVQTLSPSSRKTAAEPKPPPTLQSASGGTEPTIVVPPPIPRLRIDFSSITQGSGPKWLTWSDAADVLELIGRLSDARSGTAR